MDQGQAKCAGCCFILAYLLTVILVSSSFKVLEPTEIGVKFYGLGSEIDKGYVYTGGRYMIGLTNSFLVFPASNVFESFTASAASSDKGEVKLQITFQYKLQNTEKGEIIALYGTRGINGWKNYFRTEATRIIKEKSVIIPQKDYYENRDAIRKTYTDAVRSAFSTQGADLSYLQVGEVGLTDKFKATTIDKVVTKQSQIREGFLQSATLVRKQTDEFVAGIDAQTSVVLAEATAAGKIQEAEAFAEGNRLVTRSKSLSLVNLAKLMDFTQKELNQYLWMRGIGAQSRRGGKVMVGFEGDKAFLRDRLIRPEH